MGRLARTFDSLRAANRRALVVYLTAGDPDLDASVDAAIRAAEAGADLLEIGVPFSDPVADGPVIQKAMTRALAHGGGLEQTLLVLQRVRAATDVPIVLFGYLNPLIWTGLAEACRRIADAGGDALLVVDLPAEESAQARAEARLHNLDWVPLVAPTSGRERTKQIAGQATGFIYVVSITGVTGGDLSDVEGLQPMIDDIRAATDLPVCVGFGVRDRESARRVAAIADGVVAGTAVISALESGLDQMAACVADLRAGVDSAAGVRA